MTALAVVATTTGDMATAGAALRTLGAQLQEPRAVGGDRVLLYGRFADEAAARAAVAALRRGAWAAAERPADDDPALYAWHNRTRPVPVGVGQLVVCLPWAEFDRGSELLVEIDPGGAFGAGTHPTTCLLLEAMTARIRGGEAVLDVGCGSGVLAIAAVRLGAASAVGIDVDPAAVAATAANAARNGVLDRLTSLPTPLHDVAGTFDIVLANIGRDVLVEMAAAIGRRLRPGGWLGLSGISPAQVSMVGAAFPFLEVVATPQLDDWSAIVGYKPATAS
ncbi:MAG: ribosomal protein methyltransferase [Chloroflexota bacterium]|nr:ribosomal protein methyltransferase [Chloroflexota bacterium]